MNEKKRGDKEPNVRTFVKNLDLGAVKPRRAGVIIYTIHNGTTYFGFGLDAKYHDLTDFGGSVRYDTDTKGNHGKDSNVVAGALREFQEETLGIFKPLTYEDVQNCPVVYDKDNLIIFLHLSVDPDQVSQKFLLKHEKTKESEVCNISWLTWPELQAGIANPSNLFTRVQRFLKRVGDFSFLL